MIKMHQMTEGDAVGLVHPFEKDLKIFFSASANNLEGEP